MLQIITTTIVVIVAAVQILSPLNLPGKISQYHTVAIITISSNGLHHIKFVSNGTRLASAVHQLLASN
jgi:hypothetical protein